MLRTKPAMLGAVAMIAFAMVFPHDGAAQDSGETKLDPKLEALLKKEKASRRDCKIRICRILETKQSQGDDIACDVTKTWLKSDIDDVISRTRLSWPWGHARCETRLKLSRAMLADAMAKPAYTAEIPSHAVTCTLNREKQGETYEFEMAAAAEIEFKDGKAVDATLSWGEVKAPAVIKSLLWSATGLDNKLNIFGDEVVKIVNQFATRKCDQVKDEIAQAQ